MGHAATARIPNALRNLLLTVALCSGCTEGDVTTQQDPRNLVKVHVNGVDTDILSIIPSVTLNDRMLKILNHQRQPIDTLFQKEADGSFLFSLELPTDTSGKLDVQLDGQTEYGYTRATGTAQIVIDPGEIKEETVTLNRNEFCRLGWCQESPLPRQDTITALWAFSEDSVWAMGHHGRFQSWDGKRWRNQEPNPLSFLSNGEDLLSHQLTGIWAFSPSDVWVSSRSHATVHHFDGMEWMSYPLSAGVRRLWASGPNDIWGVGNGGVVQRFTGVKWESVPSTTSNFLWGVAGSGSSDVWMVGEGGDVLTWDGSSLKMLPAKASTSMHAVYVERPTGRIWVAGRDGRVEYCERPCTAWISAGPPDVTSYFYDIAGTGPTDIWAAGADGMVWHWNGVAWAEVKTGVTSTLYAIFIRTPNDIWFSGDGGTVLHWNGLSMRTLSGGIPTLNDIWGSAPDNLWAVGIAGSIYHYDGKTWQAVKSGVSNELTSVWGSSASDIWAVGSEVILHYDGKAWERPTGKQKPQAIPTDIPVVWGTDQSNVYISLRTGNYIRYDGTTWSGDLDSGLGADIRSLDGTSRANVRALAYGGKVARWDVDAQTWVNHSLPFAVSWHQQIRVFAPDDVWVTGTGSAQTYRFDGTTWTRMDQSGLQYGAIWGSSSQDIWLGGFGQTLGHVEFDGTTWTLGVLENGTLASNLGTGDQALNRIRRFFGFDKFHVWAVGDGGLIMRLQN